jgi:hypothetical protein
MTEQFPISNEPKDSSGNKARVLIGLAGAMLIVVVAVVLLRSSPPRQAPPAPASAAQPKLTLGVEEQAYLASVGVDHLEVSRTENFIHQEVTTVSGEISNGGARPLESVELTMEFFDLENKLAQHEVRNLFGAPGPPIEPGDHQQFELSFEHVAPTWNNRPPTVRVSSLQFAPSK